MTVTTQSARLTPAAATKLKELDGGAKPILHLYAVGETCCGVRFEIAFADQVGDGFSVSELDGVRLVVDPTSAPYCAGATVDFLETPEGAGFTVNAPGSGTCGCPGR
ncbi:HesB/IscA family protein [Kribbella sp. NPDC049227]|uniref:HesB/IscA family protein n=1 Tax=Kribbella sp. NPDC049227 TaxID=3364113 RepID=UPI00371D4FE4